VDGVTALAWVGSGQSQIEVIACSCLCPNLSEPLPNFRARSRKLAWFARVSSDITHASWAFSSLLYRSQWHFWGAMSRLDQQFPKRQLGTEDRMRAIPETSLHLRWQRSGGHSDVQTWHPAELFPQPSTYFVGSLSNKEPEPLCLANKDLFSHCPDSTHRTRART
jgi:hypothetical protein